MKINYTTPDGSIEIELVYIVKRPLRIYGGVGKCWPKQTQCLLYKNGLLLGFGEVIKHHDDVDNPAYALKEATRRIIHKINIKWIREQIWDIVLTEIKLRFLSAPLITEQPYETNK